MLIYSHFWPICTSKYVVLLPKQGELSSRAEFSKSTPMTSSTVAAYYTNIIQLSCQGHSRSQYSCNAQLHTWGKHVKFSHFLLLAISEEAKTWLSFFFVQCIIMNNCYITIAYNWILVVGCTHDGTPITWQIGLQRTSQNREVCYW